jgi:drug/metabolite transporter (DMT)-like permease
VNTHGIARSERAPLQMAPEGSSADVRWARGLLALLIVVWASSWPVIKIGVTTVPRIWYGCLRYAIAALCLFAIVCARRGLILPPRSDWPLIAVSATLQMAVYSALTGIALTALPPGRASVLAFSTPIWVVPLAAWRLQERVSPRAMFGLAFGVLSIGAIAAPSIHAGGAGGLWAYAMLISAAAAWAIVIVFVRSHTFAASPLLAPWQMLFAATLLFALAILTEGSPPMIGAKGSASLHTNRCVLPTKLESP